MDYNKIIQVYFIGIGGIGMSALARYFRAGSFEVAGYDRTQTNLTDQLIQEGCNIHFKDDLNLIPEPFKDPSLKEQTLIIYTPAIPAEHKEYNYFLHNDYSMLKRSEVLGEISKQKKSICVAGTHGKTTISTMVAHIMKQSELDCTAFLGGISKNYNSNLILGDGNWAVMEADEFDRSFLKLEPELAIISSMDADHLDIYDHKEALIDSFNQFVQNIRPDGFLVVKDSVRKKISNAKSIKIYTYGLEKGPDFYAINLKLDEGYFIFDVVTPGSIIKNLRLGFPGRINVENAIAAISIAWILKIPETIIRKSILYFSGILRRFDIRYKSENLVFIDDYAHHPAELDACINSVKELFPGKKVAGIFQPHLYTRTRDFYKDFADSLEKLDEVILLDIYPAREKAIEGIHSNIILDKIRIEKKQILNKSETLKYLETIETDVIITLGAGDIDTMIDPIVQLLKERFKEDQESL